MIRLGFNVPLVGLDRPAGVAVAPALLTYSFYAMAGAVVTDVQFGGTTTVPCYISWRFTKLPRTTLYSHLAAQTVSMPPPILIDTTATATTGGQTADKIEYRLSDAGGVLLDWTVLTGVTFRFPLFGDPPAES